VKKDNDLQECVDLKVTCENDTKTGSHVTFASTVYNDDPSIIIDPSIKREEKEEERVFEKQNAASPVFDIPEKVKPQPELVTAATQGKPPLPPITGVESIGFTVYRESFPRVRLSKDQEQALEQVKNEALFRETVQGWKLDRYKVNAISSILDKHRKRVAELNRQAAYERKQQTFTKQGNTSKPAAPVWSAEEQARIERIDWKKRDQDDFNRTLREHKEWLTTQRPANAT
jgi:hypothetical protein